MSCYSFHITVSFSPYLLGCPPILSRGEIACYWQGGPDTQPLEALDPCGCTLLVIKGATLSPEEGVASDFGEAKEKTKIKSEEQ